jgi:acyl carrier protein
MDPDLAIQALAQALDGGDCALTVMDVDWAKWIGAAQVPFLRNLPEIARAPGDGGGVGQDQDELARHLDGLSPAEQVQVLTDLIRAQAAAVLGHVSPEAIEPGRVFRDLGFDSLTALEMRQAMSAATGLRLPATLVFDYPTPDALARYLRGELTPDGEGATLPLLTELDKLESMVSAIAAGERARVATRLEGLLAKLKTAEAQVDDGAAAPELGQATAEELFELIDTEFGGR